MFSLAPGGKGTFVGNYVLWIVVSHLDLLYDIGSHIGPVNKYFLCIIFID